MSLSVEAETKIEGEPCVATLDSKLFIGTDTGHILAFDNGLTPAVKWQAHEVQLFAISAGNGKVYSASNDGGVRIWNSSGEKIGELPALEGDIGSITVHDKYVYVGDEIGNIAVYEDNTLKAKYNVLEEVKSLVISSPFMFTARDLYVTVTEIKPDESKERFITRHNMEGRAPLCIGGNRLLCISRSGNDLQLHEISSESKFKKLCEVKASEMIITGLTSTSEYCWTGGWDGVVRRWKTTGDQLQAAGELNVGSCVNALAAISNDKVYALLSGGKIVLLKA
ncbi:uncharacterized protein LOC121731682 [Aricia agestis]|uniref:uncharacterized protein LOC121731682 n=1 Tax=Aricia agestis TaxID=91739 RepID=UPI001C20A4D8|nr:uncharacterized protein LOC121731682 [Aricia agestis]